jgi:hypothetical protein
VVFIVVFPSSCCLHHILVYSKETRPILWYEQVTLWLDNGDNDDDDDDDDDVDDDDDAQYTLRGELDTKPTKV